MGVVGEPSQWSIEKFGPQLARDLRSRIPKALYRAVELAQQAREASALDTDHAFGPVRWKQQYESLHENLRDLPGVTDVHPPGAQVRVTICRDHLLLPWLYAKRRGVDMCKVGGRVKGQLIRDLLILFGPKPDYEEPTLPDMPLSPDEARDRTLLRQAIEQLAPRPKVLLIGFACNSDEGLLAVSWGEAALAPGKRLEWGPAEDLFTLN
ncbi:hypothetical protein JMF97_03275 [Micromonospora fiedleri]|uniref:Uncharacterized protein n=1 Tax=Micromonospora fiedleri TaxID=1157498 RepID=A0ABS1UIJ9_9ACTN|nr:MULTISPECIES: hypothetical protein [Micromonospora]MBL6275181.1 hypothetical protein [Micromonospora fiedleri]WSK44146.1 hypothetical protein OG712_08465 [Micromonospora maris]